MISLAMVFATLPQAAASPINRFLTGLAAAVDTGQRSQVDSFFAHPSDDAGYLYEMAKRRGGLNRLKVAILPVPPGWDNQGQFWAVFHTFQDIEEDHDPVYAVTLENGTAKLGKEIPEDDIAGWRIKDVDYSAILTPDSHSVKVATTLTLNPGTVQRAPVFRLNDCYILDDKRVLVEGDDKVSIPSSGAVVRAGSLLIPWISDPSLTYKFDYSGTLNRDTEDKVTDKVAYVTAWWIPSLGRLPFTVKGEIIAPSKWIARGEGLLTGKKVNGDLTTSDFACDLPISYPKIIAGQYTMVASKTVKGDTFGIYQLEPIDKKRAETDLQNMVKAAAFYETNLGPLPFNGYECYDADTYYGIESYSHTLLRRDITHFISHEMGHSYFGGLAPCTYVNDSWNEGVTEYIDSVVALGDADHSLEFALQTLKLDVPLSKMPVAHSYDGASYWRGCYVLKMLESEIGPDKVMRALKMISEKRKGMDTRWDDLLQYFQSETNGGLGWFWHQWVDNAVFPSLEILDFNVVQREKTFRTYIHLRQTGTPRPYRLTFRLDVEASGVTTSKVVKLTGNSDTFYVDTDDKPVHAKIEVFPYTLATVVPFK